jgi:hypothetical protein
MKKDNDFGVIEWVICTLFGILFGLLLVLSGLEGVV